MRTEARAKDIFGPAESLAVLTPRITAWTQSLLPALRLPRNPFLYAFVGSLAIHVAAAAILVCFSSRSALVPGELGSGSEPLRLVATIQLGTIDVVTGEQTAQATPATAPAAALPKPQIIASTAPPALEPAPKPIAPPKPADKSELRIAPAGPPAALVASIAGSHQENAPSQAGQPTGRDGIAAASGGADHGVVLAKPDYLHNPPPKYPEIARQRGWQGTPVLRVHVLPDGTAESVELIKTSGHRVLDTTSVEAVRDWRFVPARVGDKPVGSWVEFPIRFQLTSS